MSKVRWKTRSLFRRINYIIFALQNKKIEKVIKKIVIKKLTYLEKYALYDLAQLAIRNEKKGIRGAIIEAGCAWGGSAITLASAKSKERPFFVYDIFGTIPEPSEKDGTDVQRRYQTIANGKSTGIGGDRYYGYEQNLYNKVQQTFTNFGFGLKQNNIHLVKGLYKNTLKVNMPVALAHIDCDWYESVWTCLERITPNLVQGGTLVIDDYYYWSGAKRAVDEYFGTKRTEFSFYTKNRLHIIKR